MLHTIVPMDVIYTSPLAETEEQLCGSARLIWRKDGDTRALCRVISSDLRDFLKYTL